MLPVTVLAVLIEGGSPQMHVRCLPLARGNNMYLALLPFQLSPWRLQITSDMDMRVQSLLETPSGFLTNLSRTAE